MGSATLPRRPGELRAHRFVEARVRVRSDELDPGEAARDEVREEHVPCHRGLAGRYLHAQYFPMSVIVDAGRDEHDGSPAMRDTCDFDSD